MRHDLIEATVEHDDELLHKYLEEHELTEAEIRRCVRKATVAGAVVPGEPEAVVELAGQRAARVLRFRTLRRRCLFFAVFTWRALSQSG